MTSSKTSSAESTATDVRPVILASASPYRARMLSNAGIMAEIYPANIDEAALKQSMQREGMEAADIARGLAEMKALRVSRTRANALVIGADQILVCNGVLFSKPPDLAHARAGLQALRGKVHELMTAVCIALDNAVIWHHTERARLKMRDFSDDYLDHYLAETGDAVLSTVGAYELEGLGAQLFDRVDGDYFGILGLPLLPLLAFLRGHKVVMT